MNRSEVVLLSPSYSVREEYWYFYQIGPIDWLWRGLMTPEIAETMVARDDDFDDYEPEDEQPVEGPVELLASEAEDEIDEAPREPLAAKKFRQDLEAAKGFAKHAGWEGDCVRGPGVFWLPDPDSLHTSPSGGAGGRPWPTS